MTCSANGGCSTRNLPNHADTNDHDDTHTGAWLARERYCENFADPRGGSYGVQHYRQRCNGSGGVLRSAGSRTDHSHHGGMGVDAHDSCWPYKCWSNHGGGTGGNGYQCRNHCFNGSGADNGYCASGEICQVLTVGPRTCWPGTTSTPRGPAYECTETCSVWPYPH